MESHLKRPREDRTSAYVMTAQMMILLNEEMLNPDIGNIESIKTAHIVCHKQLRYVVGLTDKAIRKSAPNSLDLCEKCFEEK